MSLILAPRKDKSASLFLTSFDPSDLPGTSIDPLGFDRGYLYLADKVLPGMTNVANHPRYFSMLCAGSYLAETSLSDPPRVQYEKRRISILRMERFWALANVLAEREYDGEDLPTGGIRGVSYARKYADRIESRRIKNLNADFDLLSRQMPYGVIGIYASNADGMQLIDRKTFDLTPDLGELLAKDFLDSSRCPKALIKGIREDRPVKRATLTEWGLRSHISEPLFGKESMGIRDAIHRNAVRSRMLNAIERASFAAEDTEQTRFGKLIDLLSESVDDLDLLEAIRTILAFEDCYQIAVLGFERLLWLCRSHPAASLNESEVQNDPILKQVCNDLPDATGKFCKLLDEGTSDGFRLGLDRLGDIRSFLEQASVDCTSPVTLVNDLIERHSEVQKGKFDRGRRKMPWIEKGEGRISLTMTNVGGLKFEALKPSDIGNHLYRLFTALAFLEAVA